MYGTKILRMISKRWQSLLTPNELCLWLLLTFIHCQLVAQEIAKVHYKGNVKGYEISQIDSIAICQIENDYRFQYYYKT